MLESFTCTNLSFDETGYRYISNKEQLRKIKSKNIYLRCYVDDFFLAVPELSKIKDKVVKYHVVVAENVMIDNYDNIFDALVNMEKYKNVIFNLDLRLSSKISDDDFRKLMHFLNFGKRKLNVNFKLGNLSVFNVEQLTLLKSINMNPIIEVNQSYSGKFEENNEYNNVFTIDSFLEVKKKINRIAKTAIQENNDIAKILFVYMYMGKRVKYDYKISNIMDHYLRKEHDSNSIYNVLINKKGVCSSFATTFRVLMNEIGIDCQVVCSCDHEWNVVKVGDFWYHLDLTWDIDNIKANKPLQYFLKSESVIMKDNDHQLYTKYCDESEIAKKSILKRKYEVEKKSSLV